LAVAGEGAFGVEEGLRNWVRAREGLLGKNHVEVVVSWEFVASRNTVFAFPFDCSDRGVNVAFVGYVDADGL